MNKIPGYYWFSLILLLIVLGFSNFLHSHVSTYFPVGISGWIILFVFAFASGILILFLFKIKTASLILGISWIIVSLFTVIILAAMPDIIYQSGFSAYSVVGQLSKVTLAALFVFFGMIFWNNYLLMKETIKLQEKLRLIEKNLIDTKTEADLIKREALVNANEIIFEAKKKVEELERRKTEIETKLREFLQAEFAILDSYDKLLNNDK